jgi:AAA family ATP:ADP antiporter
MQINVPSAVGKWLARLVDLRRGEGRTLAHSATALFLVVTAHAVLETARDALILSRVPARHLGAVYPSVALGVLPFVALTARWYARVGARKTLVAGLTFAGATLAALYLVGASTASAVAAYILAGLFSSVLIPLTWNLIAGMLTATQARRLFGVVAAAGTLGAVTGASAALGALKLLPITGLLLLSAGIALAAIPFLPRPARERADEVVVASSRALESAGPGFADPFVRRAALLVVASTSAFLVLDFFFKWTVSRSFEPGHLPAFVARFYVLTNVAALVAQLMASRALVRRLGVAWALLVTPLLTVAGAVVAAAFGGAFPAAVVLKGLDGSLRGSVYRTSLELAYLPLPPGTRARAKTLIDGGLVRVVQTLLGGALLAGGVAGHLSTSRLAVATLGLAGLWLASAWAIRQPYLGLLRRAIRADTLTVTRSSDSLDLVSAEALIAHLAADDEFVVVGAMNALARRGRGGLVSALVLLRDEEAVLLRALAIFAGSPRSDWIPGARKLLVDSRDAVAMAAARALATHRALDAKDVLRDERPRLHGYAALYLALEDESADPAANGEIVAILGSAGAAGVEQRLGVLAAIGDAPRTERLLGLLEGLANGDDALSNATAVLARAAAAQQAVRLIPALVSRLARRDGREALRAALPSFGAAAVQALGTALRSGPRALRMHIPNTLARFGTKEAAELLLTTIDRDEDGLVRYKAIRSLGRLVATAGLKVDRARVGRLAERELIEHFRLLGLRSSVEATPAETAAPRVSAELTERLLLGMLDDKLRHSLERAFRLLKSAHPDEDLHRIHLAYVSDDKRSRAHAVELVAALLTRRDDARLLELLQIVGEEASPEDALERARPLLPRPPSSSRRETLDLLVRDEDKGLAALAALHVAATFHEHDPTLGSGELQPPRSASASVVASHE